MGAIVRDSGFLPLTALSPLHVALAGILALLLRTIYGLYTDRLSHIPGPLIARLTPLWYWYVSWRGIECRAIAALHEKYGPVVRIAPNEVDIADGAAVPAIYVDNGGLPKNAIYRNFDVNGHPTIFSVLDPAHRLVRAKAVAPLFAQQAVTGSRPAMQKIIDATVAELARRKSAAAAAAGAPVDVLNLFRALAMDAMTEYLTGRCFGGVGPAQLSATAFVDNFTAGGRFFQLPGWAYDLAYDWTSKLDKNKALIAASSDIVESFAARVVDDSIASGEDETYQGRLLAANVCRDEAIGQIMDIMFAGTDAEARILAVFCWHLVQDPDMYDRARKEVLQSPGVDARSLPYLSGAVKEACRLSMANPTRLPRIVPPGGLRIPGMPEFPAGTSVGVGAYSLHSNPAVFPSPHAFRPERWLESTPEMLRDSFHFGKGARQCIARNFASAIMWWAAEALLRSDVLEGARAVGDRLEIVEWFNAKQVGGKIELSWA